MKELRLRHLFGADQRSVIVAFDHAAFMGPVHGLEDPGCLLDQIVDTGVDAVLTTMGVARTYCGKFGKLGLILRVDGGATARCSQPGTLHSIFSVEDALRLGADAVACMGMIGFPEEPASIDALASLSSDAARWNLPLLAEMLVKGAEDQPPTAEDVGFAMRIGVELGADLIKAPYVGPVEQYRAALGSCYRPTVVLGGSKVNEERALFESVQEALRAGASGVAIGRNVWQHSNPAGICRGLVALVHQGASIDQALQVINQ